MPDSGEAALQATQPASEAGAIERWLIRIRAYFRKEVSELRRQPMLILSLIGGPLLVLLAFGASFTSSNPVLRTVVVIPPGGIAGLSPEEIARLAGTNFEIVGVTEDRAAAEAQLRAGQVDVVQVLPTQIMEAVERGESPAIVFLSNAIDPLNEGWIQYLAYAETNEINKALLRQQTANAQQQVGSIEVKLADARGQLGELTGELTGERQAQIQQDLRALRQALVEVQQRLPEQAALLGLDSQVNELRERVLRLQNNLEAIDKAMSDGTIRQRIDEIRATQEQMLQLEGVIQVFVKLSPDAIVAPVGQTYSNVRGSAYSAMVFYAPGVLALLVQHTAITLGALALVRERLMGAFEVFRVAPVNMIQLLIGKYLGYTLFIVLTAAVLIAALLLLGVPLLGSWLLFAVLVLLLTLASLGVGFLISTVSSSDSQAIQLAMITLLLSIFFSGFFISLDSFAKPALALSYSIPMTHGVQGFQSIMLRGLAPSALTWIGLGLIALVTFMLVVVLTGRQFRKA
ncbi:MAG TPA: ABC transporter permease [Roseiflexaceae bacterium]|nr:ABC transporter permease [Roseiflexaceae bacterium]